MAFDRLRSSLPAPSVRDRYLQLGLTFGGAGVIRGDLTPECAAAVTAVLEALGKKQGREDDRTQGQRFHDALAEACHLLLRARLAPDRAGADTQVIVHVPIGQLRQLPGAAGLCHDAERTRDRSGGLAPADRSNGLSQPRWPN